MLDAKEQLLTAVYSGIYALYMMGVDDKVTELSRWKQVILREIKEVTSKKLGLQIFWTLKINRVPFKVVIVLLHSQHQKAKRKFWKFGER